MNDDEWRVEVELDDGAHGAAVGERLADLVLDEDARARLGGEVMVTHDGPRVMLYADSAAQAGEAERVVREVLADEQLPATVAVTRYHPIAEQWRDAAEPLPETEQAVAAERAANAVDEVEEVAEEGRYDWDVRIDCAHRGDAVELHNRLRAEGLPVQRRWTHVRVGVLTEQAGIETAKTLRERLPAGATIALEVNPDDVPSPGFVLWNRIAR